ncbi:MAG: hypothetical protein WCJ09_22995 [Planctomycetota bacterium]
MSFMKRLGMMTAVFVAGTLAGGLAVFVAGRPVERHPEPVVEPPRDDSATVRVRLLEKWNRCHLKAFDLLIAETLRRDDVRKLTDDDFLGLMSDLKKNVETAPDLLSNLCEFEASQLDIRQLRDRSRKAVEEALEWRYVDETKDAGKRLRLMEDMALAQSDPKKQEDIHRRALDYARRAGFGYTTRAREEREYFFRMCRMHEHSLALLHPNDSHEPILVFQGSVPALRADFGNLKRFQPVEFGWNGYETWSYCDDWLKRFDPKDTESFPPDLVPHVRAVRDHVMRLAITVPLRLQLHLPEQVHDPELSSELIKQFSIVPPSNKK